MLLRPLRQRPTLPIRGGPAYPPEPLGNPLPRKLLCTSKNPGALRARQPTSTESKSTPWPWRHTSRNRGSPKQGPGRCIPRAADNRLPRTLAPHWLPGLLRKSHLSRPAAYPHDRRCSADPRWRPAPIDKRLRHERQGAFFADPEVDHRLVSWEHAFSKPPSRHHRDKASLLPPPGQRRKLQEMHALLLSMGAGFRSSHITSWPS